jgi:Uma2 family endonuclease
MADSAPAQTRITAQEFARLPETNLPMELIDGEIITMASPKNRHQGIAARLFTLIQNSNSGGTLLFAPMDVYLDDLNVVQPDIFWVSGEQSICKLGADDYWHGAPDLVIEILSEGTALRDRREKFSLYEKHGTQEYWLVDPANKVVEIWQRQGSQFQRQGVHTAGETFNSAVLGGKGIDLTGVFSV